MTGSADAQNNRAISGLTATSAVPGQIAVDWDDVTDAKDYRVMWAKENDPYKTWTDLTGNHFPTVSAHTITGLEEGEAYKLKVRARFDEGGSGPWSQPVHTLVASTPRPPAAPTGLAASLVFHDNVVLDWDDPDDDSITGYKILRRTTGEFTTIEANTASQATSYTDSSVEAETEYAYHIRAINDDGESDPSSNLNVTTPEEPEVEVVDPDPPAAPTGLSASALQATTVTLDWDDTDDENVDGYQILRRNRDGKEHGDGNGPTEFSLIVEDTESTDTSHRDSSATEETRYEYRVKARWADLISDASDTVQVETPPLRKGRNIHNTDATLSSITVDSTAVPGFAHDRTSYEYGVASTVTQVTIAATTTDADASWAVTSPTDPGHQVNLSVGANTVTITVTAEDAATVETYTVSINRSTDATFGWNAVQDLDNFAPDVTILAPKDLTRNDGTFLVLFQDQNYLRAYDADGTRDTTLDVALDNNNAQAEYIHTDGQNFWISDQTDDKIYVYDTSGNRQDTMEFDLDPDNSVPAGIWSDGTTMWVADAIDDKVYAYSLSGTRQMAKEFDLHSSNDSPTGIWSDGVTIWVADEWVADEFGDRIFAYSLDDHSQDTSKEFRTLAAAGNGVVLGIWSDGTTMWAMDQDDAKAYSYNMPVSDNAQLRTITIDGEEVSNFDPDTRFYNVTVDRETTQITVNAQPRQIKARLTEIRPPDADNDPTNGHQVALMKKTTYVSFFVTAQNGRVGDYYGAIVVNPQFSLPPVLSILDDPNPSWDENTPPNAVNDVGNAIVQISTKDPDGDDLKMRFYLDMESQKYFSISSTNLKKSAILHHKVALNHEAIPVHNVVFAATDEDGKVALIEIAITVNDLDDPGVVQLVPPVAITGIPVTAVVDDPEELVSSQTWQWYRGDAQNGPWTVINGQTSNSTRRPKPTRASSTASRPPTATRSAAAAPPRASPTAPPSRRSAST